MYVCGQVPDFSDPVSSPVKLEVVSSHHSELGRRAKRDDFLAGAGQNGTYLASAQGISLLIRKRPGLLRMPQALAKDDSKEKDSKIPSINKNISAMCDCEDILP